MDPTSLIFLLVAAGVVLLLAELLLPTHGVLGVLGLLCLGAAIVVVFTINKWAGLIVFLAAILVSPLLLNLAMKLWAKSPVGRRVILQPVENARASVPVTPGQVGTTVTELRPLGECDFGDARLEVASQLGIIRAGTKVRIVAIEQGRPTVRAVEN
jgi:membrane-bound serine protease (ClpP class)